MCVCVCVCVCVQAGMIEEMLDETFEGLEDDDLEELADREVEKVLWEVTSGQLGELSGTPSATPQEEGVSQLSRLPHAVCVCVFAGSGTRARNSGVG